MLNIDSFSDLKPNLVDACVDRLANNETVVVETRRLQHLVETQYNLQMRDNGCVAWPSAEVYVWDVWLTKLWSTLGEQKPDKSIALLTPNQSMQLWEQTIREVVKDTSDFEYLLWHITASANNAKSAYRLMCLYRIDDNEFDDRSGPDAVEFLRWLDRYRQKLQAGKWLDYEKLPEKIRQNAADVAALSPHPIFIAGFDSWPPQYQQMISALTDHGAKVEVRQHDRQGSSSSKIQPQRLRFESTDEEIKACALWARSVIEENPDAHKVGIAVPRLQRTLNRMNRMFSAHLNPDSILEKRETRNMSFHVTLGTELAKIPVVADALNLIELIRTDVDIFVMNEVIRSDRIRGWDKESGSRSFLAEKILTLGTATLSIDNVLSVIECSECSERSKKFKCPQLAEVLQNGKKLLSSMPTRQSYSAWGQFFMDWMKNFQSEQRDDRKFGVEESQAHQSWCKVVESLSELDLISPAVDANAAIAKLTRLVSQKSTQPRALQTPIQIGEMVTMSGQSFTHLWIMGMNNTDLPGTANPNPFIPIELQKSHHIPDCSAEALLERMNQRLERLLSGTQSAVLSYASTDANELFQPNAHMKGWQDFVIPARFERQTYKQLLSEHIDQCKSFSDWKAKPIGDDELKTFKGGSKALQNQTKCSFRAFAESRLKAQQCQTLEIGINALDHGKFAHELLHTLYEKYDRPFESDSSNENFDIETVKKLAHDIIQKANSTRIRPFRKELIEAEIQLLTELANKWLECDQKRENFVDVYALEKKLEVLIRGLPVTLIVDRVDVIAGDPDFSSNQQDRSIDCKQLAVIDYKTSSSYTANSVNGDRPQELQLLLYAYALEDLTDCEVWGIFYGILTKAEAKLVKGSLDECAEKRQMPWKRIVTNMAERFMQGDAAIDPIRKGCQYCHLAPLCRIDAKLMKA